MKKYWTIAAILLPAAWVCAADQPATAPATQPDDSGLVVAYTGDPPNAGQVTTRLEAEGGRCASDPTIMDFVWCPPVDGLTTAAHPKLIWYLNKPLSQPVMVVLTYPSQHDTYHLWQSSGAVPAGIHVLDTSAGGVSLQVGVQYKWTVRIINDAGDPSKDTYSSGMIRRVDSSDPDAGHHCFYDAMGQVVTALSDAAQSHETARADALEKAVSRLLGTAQLQAIDQFTITVDKAAVKGT